MTQREVAQRIAAPPGSSEYGALSAVTQLHAKVTELFTLPPQAFDPPPDVHSTVFRLDFAPRFAELSVPFEGFNRFLRATFAQKRKTLSNNLRAAGYSPAQLTRRLARRPASASPRRSRFAGHAGPALSRARRHPGRGLSRSCTLQQTLRLPPHPVHHSLVLRDRLQQGRDVAHLQRPPLAHRAQQSV